MNIDEIMMTTILHPHHDCSCSFGTLVGIGQQTKGLTTSKSKVLDD